MSRVSASIHTLYKYLQSNGAVTGNPFLEVKRDKCKRALPQILTKAEVELLLEQPDITEFKGLRDRCMLEVLYATGIRVTELVDLNVEDVNISIGFIRCHPGEKERIVPLYPLAVRFIVDYLNTARPIFSTPKSGSALFLNMSGERLTRQGFWKLLKKYLAVCGNPQPPDTPNASAFLCGPPAGKRRRFEVDSGDARPY